MTEESINEMLEQQERIEEAQERFRERNGSIYCAAKPSELAHFWQIGSALPLLLWMRSNRVYYSTKVVKDNHKYVTQWIKKGFVVAKFTRADAAHSLNVSERTITNHIKKLVQHGYIKKLSGGASIDGENVPQVFAVGLWRRESGQNRAMFAGWLDCVFEMAHAGDEASLSRMEALGYDV